MRVLVACECSGRLRQMFREAGHDAWSIDMQPARDQSAYHIQDDASSYLHDSWDLVVAHPPCTHLSNAGARWPKTDQQINEAIEFFWRCYSANAPKVAVENPVMNRKRTGIRRANFSVQPWQFGGLECKRTCFWTRGLEPLQPTVKEKPADAKQTVWRLPPSSERAYLRSLVDENLCRAIVNQWGRL